MSLVAYAASSDEESENEEENTGTQVELLKPQAATSKILAVESTNGHISDEDDDYVPQELPLQELRPVGRLTLALPKPKLAESTIFEPEENVEDDQVTRAFAKLPLPRSAAAAAKAVLEEEDDEFLHKKAAEVSVEKPPPPPAKTRVKISIPSLKAFSDVDKEKADKLKNREIRPGATSKGSGLLSILPQAKSERDFAKKPEPAEAEAKATKPRPAPAFVPDTVKQRRTAHNTEGVDGLKAAAKPPKKAIEATPASDSEDDDDDEGGDFFSLNSKQQPLPEVSSNEINALVAKRAAKMLQASHKYLEESAEQEAAEQEAAERSRQEEEQLQVAQKRYQEQHLDNEAMDALVGKNAKRRRKEARQMQVIDISGTEVLPDRDEWMRTALASSTQFQPTGVLNEDEQVAGTRRKHQITYLAHKAKSNEAELQAMWSANRQTRRDTQNKYGF